MEWTSIASTGVLIVDYAVKFFAVGYVPENRRPSSSSAWLLLILLLPVVGVPLFLMLGSPYVNRRRMRIQVEANDLMQRGTEGLPDYPASLSPPPALASLITLSRTLTALPMVTGENHGVSTDYEGNIRRAAALVDEAEEYVHCEIYIMAWDHTTDVFFEALVRAATRGVKVRVLLDHLGSRKYPGFHRLGKRLEAAGIEYHLMLPFLPLQGRARRIDLRNHRKLLVVDGRRGMMGSQNMIDSTYLSKGNIKKGRHWHDLMVELTGEVVAELEALFATDWYTESGQALEIRDYREELEDFPGMDRPEPAVGGVTNGLQIVPSGPGFKTAPNLRLFTSLVYLAQRKLSIVSPYFVPDESMLAAIITAGFRGVEVELYVSEQADQFMVDHAQSSYYDALLEAGVRIYRYPKPAVLHTKCFVVDDLCCIVGSSNMDMRSFGLNFEVSMLSTGGDLTAEVIAVIDDYREISRELTSEEWSQRSYARRWVDSAMRLTSALQ